jgi:hypothetical protein
MKVHPCAWKGGSRGKTDRNIHAAGGAKPSADSRTLANSLAESGAMPAVRLRGPSVALEVALVLKMHRQKGLCYVFGRNGGDTQSGKGIVIPQQA